MRSMDDPAKQFNETIAPGSLNFMQAQVNWILGQSLASIYQDILKAPVPQYLQDLLDQLNEEHTSLEDNSGSHS
jgi:hypothetical protein